MRVERQCESCKGTGLYRGMAERDSFAVVCRTCGGSGKEIVEIKVTPFTGRKVLKGVSVVLECNPGICVGGEDLRKFGGMLYRDWNEGKSFPIKSEMRNYVCPAWWYQNADYRKKPNWDSCNLVGSFSSCEHFQDKESCWIRWDKENGRK